MRFKLTIQLSGPHKTLPINYQYELSSWIYKTIHFGNPEFAAWLHNHGFMDGYKKFRLFTFSHIVTDAYRIQGDRFEILTDSCALFVSFYAEEAVEPFITGLFKHQQFSVGDQVSCVQFRVTGIEKLPEPEWRETMMFRTDTPLVVTKKETESSKYAQYLSPEEQGYSELFLKNLLTRYITLMKQQQKNSISISSGIDMKFKLMGKPRSKMVKIKAGTTEETLIKGYIFDFAVTAPKELLRLGYYAGFGEKNSLGFGCCRIT